MSDRDAGGRFVKGNKASPGRRPRAVEEREMEMLGEVMTDERFRVIVEKVVSLAEAGNQRAIELILKYKWGLPTQRTETALTVTDRMTIEQWRVVKDGRVAKVEVLDE